MARDTVQIAASTADEGYQNGILPHVSRTFALTIPQLPAALRVPVTNAYLLCRIADTIEDETPPAAGVTLVLLQRFVAVACGKEDADLLARDVAAQLSERTLQAERDLILNMKRVVGITAGFDDTQRIAIQRCVDIMCHGMHEFQQTASLRGLPCATDLDDYCYYVAGVVGQMLTELFCSYSEEIRQHRGALHDLAVSFAQGLQMTNILKDVWEDRARGACWLPQEVFTRYGVDLGQLTAAQPDPRFDAGMRELVGVAHVHLRNALAYTLLIPPRETGIRRFCLWAIGLAVLTLQRIAATPGFTSGAQVKVSHAAVGLTQISTNLAVRNDWLLRRLFDWAARGLPLAAPNVARRTPRPALHLAGPTTAEKNIGARPVPLERPARRSEGRSGL
ncbi:MAG TPA: phytoene/squalene synthase family protein [Steroidobacteraceae bacterium]|nr:phytoene/squalene synthase family protein [Steroidobacteraceae bacterium]